jgi:hypothetical protein
VTTKHEGRSKHALKTRKKRKIKGERADINTNEARPVSEKSHICAVIAKATAQGKTVNWRKISIAQVCAFLSPIWRTKGASLCYLFTTITAPPSA